MNKKLDNSKNGTPVIKTWKQWFLIYPTFAIAVLGAIPQYIDVVKGLMIGVATSEVSNAEKQHSLWVKNSNCHLSLEPITTAENTQVSAGVCGTGDIQINIEFPDQRRVIHWFSLDEISTLSSIDSFDFISSAEASDTIFAPITIANLSQQVICQKMSSNGEIVRIVRVGEQCHQELINSYTGQIKERNPVNCNSSCSGTN